MCDVEILTVSRPGDMSALDVFEVEFCRLIECTVKSGGAGGNRKIPERH
jgi:hypothetical protein